MTDWTDTIAAGPRPSRHRGWRALQAAILLAATAWPSAEAGAETSQPQANHLYVPVAGSTPSADAQALATRLGGEAKVLDLVATGEDRPLARVEAAFLPEGGAQILDWRTLAAVPVLRRDIRAEEERRLAEALDAHLPEGSTILAFPGLSRRLAALVPASFPLADAPEPLVLPEHWAGRAAEVAAAEAGQWGGRAATGAEDGPTGRFLDALLAEDVSGAARLRVLAGSGEAYALVHLEDAFQIGGLRSGRLEIVRRDFAATGFSHDLAREARRWGRNQDYAAWAVERARDGNLRGHYLVDPLETATLAAQLLPFNTSRIDAVPGLRLVWQWQGYWLYRVAPVANRDQTD